MGFPCGSVGKESACTAGNPGLIPGSGRSPGEGNDYPLQYPCLENLMDRGAWGRNELDMTERLTLQFSSVQLLSVSNSLRPHESQHTRPPCPSPSPRAHSDSCPSSPWCHPAISSWVVPFSSCPQFLPASVFSNESTLRMRWPKYWSFSFNIIPSKESKG